MRHVPSLHTKKIDSVAAIKIMVCNPPASGTAERRALSRSRAQFRMETQTFFFGTRFHFREDQNLILRIPGEQIDLIAAHADVPITDRIPNGQQISLRNVLSACSEQQMCGSEFCVLLRMLASQLCNGNVLWLPLLNKLATNSIQTPLPNINNAVR